MTQNELACLLTARSLTIKMREDLRMSMALLVGLGISRVPLVECAWRLDDTIREITDKLKEEAK